MGDMDGCIPPRKENVMDAPRRVLVIEDDAALRDVLCEALDSAGYRALPSDHPVSPLDEFLAAVTGCMEALAAPGP
jgi:CheY-like chemotaxis protein